MGAEAGRRHDGAMSETFALKLRTWWLRDELDEQLEHGADPMTDAGLARRAAQLRSRSTRTQMADALETALDEARKKWTVSVRLPLRRVAVRECADDLVAVAQRLRANEPIDVRGAAMVARLVFNATSPLYHDGSTSLRYVLRSARLALDPPAVVRPKLSEVA
jgi:hypothetical protein